MLLVDWLLIGQWQCSRACFETWFLVYLCPCKDQESKLGLSKNESIICYYNTYQMFQFNLLPLVVSYNEDCRQPMGNYLEEKYKSDYMFEKNFLLHTWMVKKLLDSLNNPFPQDSQLRCWVLQRKSLVSQKYSPHVNTWKISPFCWNSEISPIWWTLLVRSGFIYNLY